MKQKAIILSFFVALTFFSTKLFGQQEEVKTDEQIEQIERQKVEDATKIEGLKYDNEAAKEVAKDAQKSERDAVDASKQSKSALKAEKKAQKSRKKADAQIKKAERAKSKSDQN